jgi:crotonobetainyl-CoA:carnitine CoA-transferase CaiB-like acyl-CoA transferase
MTAGSRTPRVVDFSTHFSGPIASRQLAQLGADVIKVEHPRYGDGNRQVPPLDHGTGTIHYYMNAGARSLAVNSRSRAWKPVVEALTRWADVVIVGNRPANARRLGLDLPTLLGHNPRLIYCLITGYGLEGDWAEYPAHGLNMDALAGAVPIESRDGYPVAPEAYRSFGTTLAGLQAAIGILAALHRRDAGEGAQFVHTSCWEAALGWMWRDVTTQANLGRPWDRYMDLGSRYSMYWTSDDQAILVCPIEKRFWESFCDLLEMPEPARRRGDWGAGMDWGRGYEDEKVEIQARMRTRTRAEWQRLLAEADIPFAPVLTWAEAMSSSHAEANGVLTDLEYEGRRVRASTTPVSVSPVGGEHGTSTERLARLHREKGQRLSPPPRLGEHSGQILEELGLTDLRGALDAADGEPLRQL